MKIPVKITLTEEARGLYPNGKPEYATEGSSGFDIRAVEFSITPFINDEAKEFLSQIKMEAESWEAYINHEECSYELPSKSRILVKTGLRIQLQKGYELQIRPRSGLALKHGISIVNSPATIDSDYTGEICVILENRGHDPFEIKIGDRIAQGIIAPVFQADFEVVETLEETERGQGGFGSTGTN